MTMVTGGAGYIGRVLVDALRNSGRHVVVVDRLLYGPISPDLGTSGVDFIQKDIRDLHGADLVGVDELFDLAAISTEAAAELLPELTWEVNYAGRRRLAELARRAGVGRYILPSSSNVYGSGNPAPYTEDDEVEPHGIYAAANRLAERRIIRLRTPEFTPIVLRQATVFGWSPCMRYDLVINAMTASLVRGEDCRVMGDGTQRRPFVWIGDLVRTYLRLLEIPVDRVIATPINVGSAEDDYPIGELPALLGEILGVEATAVTHYGAPDPMSHRLSYRRLWEVTGLSWGSSLTDGVRELADRIRHAPEGADEPSARRAKWLEATWYLPTN
ncbi:NAD-dependent epimerase/dehydratase [Amycolatopsis decaplanina DSM 44594]|uniref:NAD-dependent epimerase/dehydratase n=1 Tax=Amycolatopsis decaplanina DSM 44594 TaxID=1284240 RepID=M2X969_9PSEU|nr:NAD-dependent epimerase/dehydratase [Amycolatopsis decaplanina DSM 44594]